MADIPGTRLGVTSAEGIIWIDRDAAGWGWFVDPTPAESSEFLLPGDRDQQNRMDLLTVVMHELGHVLGFDHDASDNLMSESLLPGVRRLPTAGISAASLVDVFMPPLGASTLQTPLIVAPLPEDSNSPELLAAPSPSTTPIATAGTMRSELEPPSRTDEDDPFVASDPFWNLDDDLLELLTAR